MPVTVDFEAPATARIVGAARFIAYVKRLFPTAKDQGYSGASLAGNWIKRLVIVYGAFLRLLVLLLGGSSVYDRSRRDASSASPRDVEQTLELTASELTSTVSHANT